MVPGDPGLRMTITKADGQIAFDGDLHLEDAPRVERALREAVDECEVGLSIDLTGVTFLGSTGVRLLLTADERANRIGLAFVLGDGPARAAPSGCWSWREPRRRGPASSPVR